MKQAKACASNRQFQWHLTWQLLLFLCPWHSLAQVERVVLTPVADTSLLQAFPANNFGGNEYFNAGTTQNYTTNRGLMKFDVASALPLGAKVVSATLTLEVVGSPVDGNTPSNFRLHRVLRDWGEGVKLGHPPQQSGLGQRAGTNEATWFDRFAFTTNSWALPGGAAGIDYAAAPSSETFVYGINFSPYLFGSTPAVVADVQDWLRFPQANFGWMLITQSETNNFTARRFASREDPDRAPLLAVEYFLPRFDSIVVNGNLAHLRLTAIAEQAYAVEYCDLLSANAWQTLTNILKPEITTPIELTEPITSKARFYRLRVQ